MTKASAHDKQMKNFMRAKIFMLCIEKGKLQCIDDAANGVDDTADHKPEESSRRQGSD